MPLGLGKVVILEYIEVALGLLVVNDIGVAGSVSKRKVWRRGPNRPWGSIARGMRTMLRVRSSPIVVLGAALENFEINKFHRNTFLMS